MTAAKRASKGRTKAVKDTVSRYNQLVRELDLLEAPPWMTPIMKHMPWCSDGALDVDPMDDTWASLWQNMLQVEWTDSKGPPAWVSDPNVRSGIKAVLMLDRIREERERCCKEHESISRWLFSVLHEAVLARSMIPGMHLKMTLSQTIMRIHVDKLKHRLDLRIRYLAQLRRQVLHIPPSRSQFWLAPDSAFLSADSCIISDLFSEGPGLPVGRASPSPSHRDGADESEDGVDSGDEDRIVVEREIAQERQLETFSAINNEFFNKDDSFLDPNHQKSTDAVLESQEDLKLVAHQASPDYGVWDTILSAKLTTISDTFQRVSIHFYRSPPDSS